VRARGILTMAMATAALTGCGDFLSLDAQAPNACVTVTGVKVPGLDAYPTNMLWPQSPTLTTSQAFEVPFDDTVLPQGSAYTVKLTSFRLEAQGAQDLSFVESARLSAIEGTTRTEVATYTRASSATTVEVVEAAPDPAPDVTPYIVDGVLRLEGELTGTVPQTSFVADATVCFDVATTISAL